MAKRSDRAEHEDKDPIIRRWEKLAAAGCEIDVGFELLPLAMTLHCDGSIKRTHYPSGLAVPKRFELLRAQVTRTMVRWDKRKGLVRFEVCTVTAALKPIAEPS